MLVLTRMEGESIIFILPDGQKMTVKVVERRGSQIRIGIDAPQTIRIWREELVAA